MADSHFQRQLRVTATQIANRLRAGISERINQQPFWKRRWVILVATVLLTALVGSFTNEIVSRLLNSGGDQSKPTVTQNEAVAAQQEKDRQTKVAAEKAAADREAERLAVAKAASNSLVDKPMLIELSEINVGNYTADPWLSQDGLTIYWVTEDRWIWTASRENDESLFGKKKRLVKGTMPTVSLDGLEMIFVSARGDGANGRSFFVTTRQSMTSLFLRPKEIAASLQLRFPGNPCLSVDELTLYFGMVDTSKQLRKNSTTQDQMNVWSFGTMTRKDKTSSWSTPKDLPLNRTGLPGKLTWVFPSGNELSILCAREGIDYWGKGQKQGGFMLWTRDSKRQPFVSYSTIRFEGLVPLIGRSPRYCEKTKELIFVRDLRHEGNNKFALWMVKGVKLDQFPSSQ